MKTEVPVQGFKICAHHHVTHLALFFAQPACMYYFRDSTCDNTPTFRSMSFMFVHAWCFVSQIISNLLNQKAYQATANIFNISCVPLYIYCIYLAHFYELESQWKDKYVCPDPNKADMLYMWFIIELRVFYGFILSGILFLMAHQIVGIEKSRRVNGVRIKGGSNGDFVEKYFPAKIEFCRKTFELIMTSIIIVEYYSRADEPQFGAATGTFLYSMIVLMVYGVVTAAESFVLFRRTTLNKTKK
jgi:hypothetical protein